MNSMTYVMNEKMYYKMTHNDAGQRIRGESGVIMIINNSFGLKGEVTDIQIKNN